MTGWIAQHFLHPSYVLPWGIALAALPVIIHLINRLRFKRVRFAAMEFLLRSERRNRRRVFIEQLLLLLLRVGIVAALLMLLGRLVVDPTALWAFRGGKAHHIVLLDDSASMRDRWGETSAFQEGVAVVRKLVGEGMRRPGTEQLTLIYLSQPDRPVFLKRDVNNALAAEVERVFERAQCSYRALDLVDGIQAATQILTTDAGNARHLHVISDFRASDWRERPALRNAFVAASKTGATIDLAKTVGEAHENLAITDLSGDVRAAASGVPVRLSATVRNFGNKLAERVRLAVTADGTLLPLTLAIDKIEAGQQRTQEIDLTFKKPGKHSIEVQLPEDSLPADGRRFAAIEVNISNPVLIIDGNPESDDGGFVATALAADPAITGFTTRIESPDFLSREPLESFRCIYLLNVPQLRADAVEALANYVREGGGIAWFLGGVVNTAFYNDTLYKKAGGLFPVSLAPTVRQNARGDEESQAADLSFAPNKPMFRIFQGQNNPFIDAVRIHSWIPVADGWKDDNTRRDGVETIARVVGQPFAFERMFGKGRVLAFLSTAGPAWNDWARNPSVVVFHLELAKHMARPDQVGGSHFVGEPIEVAFSGADFLETVEITATDATGQRLTRVKATRPNSPAGSPSAGDAKTLAAKSEAANKNAGGRKSAQADASRLTATFADTNQPGLYIVRLFKDQAATPQERWMAYNVSGAESDLKLASTSDILARLSNDVKVHIHEPGAFHGIEGQGTAEEARTLLLVVLAVALVAEQLFSYRLSYHPTPDKGAA